MCKFIHLFGLLNQKEHPIPPKEHVIFVSFHFGFSKEKKPIIHTCVRTIFYNAVAKLI